ncbi:MAG: hypothetical protein H0U73_01435 [Tatlockia sp.]|nr:hypothetical protein [Tatlockia sp.]
MSFSQQKELNAAAESNNKDKVVEFCTLPVEEAPIQVDIDEALKVALKTKSLEVINYLLTLASKEAVSNALIVFCKWKDWQRALELCTSDAVNQLNPEAINKTLDLAADAKEWPLVQTIYRLKLDKDSPSQDAINSLLKKPSLPIEVLKDLFENSTTKPSKKAVESLLTTLLKASTIRVNKWKIIEHLSLLSGENKPDVINKVVTAANSLLEGKEKVDILTKLITMQYKNAPTQDVLIDLLNDFMQNPDIPLDLIKLLCETSLKKPSQDDISDAIIAALSDESPIDWSKIEYLTTLIVDKDTTNHDALNRVLLVAAKAGKWDLVKSLLELKTPNRPSCTAVDKLLSTVKKGKLPLDLMQHMFEKGTTKPSEGKVNAVLEVLIKSKDSWAEKSETSNYIYYLCTLSGEVQPSKTVILMALEEAVLTKRIDMVKKIAAINTANAPDNKGIAALILLATKELESSLEKDKKTVSEIIEHLCQLIAKNSPKQEDLDKELGLAIRSKNTILVNFLCELETNKPSQPIFDESFAAACDTGSLEIVQSPTKLGMKPSLVYLSVAHQNAVKKSSSDEGFAAIANYLNPLLETANKEENPTKTAPRMPSRHRMFDSTYKPKSKNDDWEMSCTEMILWGFLPVAGWAVLAAYFIYRSCCISDDVMEDNDQSFELK